MKQFFSNIWAFIRQPLPAILLGVLVISVVALLFFTGGNSLSNYDIEDVRRQTVTQEVNVTGRVEPAEELDLSVERGGRIVSSPVAVGQRVSRGALLVSVSSGTLGAQRQDALASLEREELKLAQLKSNGSGSQAGASLANARTGMNVALRNSFVDIDSALGIYIDQFYSSPRSGASFGARFNTADGQSLVLEGTSGVAFNLSKLRNQLNEDMEAWQAANTTLTSDTDRERAFTTALASLDTAGTLSNDLSLYINARTSENAAERAIYNELKSDIAAFRGQVASARSNITTSHQTFVSAQTGVSSDEIRFQELLVAQARARLSGIDAQLAEGAIRAPIAGTITRNDAKVGEYLSPATPVVTLASEASFEIETFVPEADIAKISVGDRAELTLDAFDSDDVFDAEVVFIDPAETISEGIATFKVTLHFVPGEDTSGVRPGMTADIDIATGREENVIAVSQRAITQRDGVSYVEVVRGEQIVEVEVETGLRGTDGLIEITDGLEEGEKIVVFTRE